MDTNDTSKETPPLGEKKLEKLLIKRVKEIGGKCVKWVTSQNAGLPDRICLLPGGQIIFVELKSPGKKLTKIQQLWRSELVELGFRHEVISTVDSIEKLFSSTHLSAYVEELPGKIQVDKSEALRALMSLADIYLINRLNRARLELSIEKLEHQAKVILQHSGLPLIEIDVEGFKCSISPEGIKIE